ncbi:MAG: hypothetical protein KatS3mg051_1581 [Anaerolineae bacterium]|nr:MAG: hypothetical protein KatS3mg051_1581 [Anaerolineae bacterium]
MARITITLLRVLDAHAGTSGLRYSCRPGAVLQVDEGELPDLQEGRDYVVLGSGRPRPERRRTRLDAERVQSSIHAATSRRIPDAAGSKRSSKRKSKP